MHKPNMLKGEQKGKNKVLQKVWFQRDPYSWFMSPVMFFPPNSWIFSTY